MTKKTEVILSAHKIVMLRLTYSKLSSQELVNRVALVDKENLALVTSIVFARKAPEDVLAQIKLLKIFIHLKKKGNSNDFFATNYINDTSPFQQIKDFTQNASGEAQIYGQVFLTLSTPIPFSNKLVKQLVVNKTIHYFASLLTPKQWQTCIDAFLKQPHITDLKGLTALLSFDPHPENQPALLEKILPKLIVNDRGTTLKTMKALIPHLHKDSKIEVLKYILPVLNHSNQVIRQKLVVINPYDKQTIIDREELEVLETLEAIKPLVMYLKEESQQKILKYVLPKLGDQNNFISQAALTVIRDLMPNLQENNQDKVIQEILSHLYEPVALKIIGVLIPHLHQVGQQKALQAILLRLNDTKWNIRMAALNTISILIPYLQKNNQNAVLQAIVFRLNDEKNDIRQITLEIIKELIPSLQEFILPPNILETIVCCLKKVNAHSYVTVLKATEILISRQREVILPQNILEVMLSGLTDENSIIPFTMRKAIKALMPHLHKDSQQKILEHILTGLNHNQWVVRVTTLGVMRALIPHLSKDSQQKILKDILPRLNDDQAKVRQATLKAITPLIPHLPEDIQQKMLQDILPKLNDDQAKVRQATLKAITPLIPHLLEDSRQKVLQAILFSLNDKSLFISKASLEIISAFFPYLKEDNQQKILQTILLRFTDENKEVRDAALQAIRTLTPHLSKDSRKKVLEVLLPRLNNKWSIYDAVLETIKTIPHLQEDSLQNVLQAILPKLNDENSAVKLKAIKNLVPYLPQDSQQGVLESVTPMLHVSFAYIQNTAREIIRAVMPNLPQDIQKKIQEDILSGLNNGDKDIREATLTNIRILMPYLHKDLILETFRRRLNDDILSVRREALEILTLLIPDLKEDSQKKILKDILQKLNDNNVSVCTAALEAIKVLILHLHENCLQLEEILPKLNSEIPFIREAAQEAISALIPYLQEDSQKQLLKQILLNLDHENKAIRQETLPLLTALLSHLTPSSHALLESTLKTNPLSQACLFLHEELRMHDKKQELYQSLVKELTQLSQKGDSDFISTEEKELIKKMIDSNKDSPTACITALRNHVLQNSSQFKHGFFTGKVTPFHGLLKEFTKGDISSLKNILGHFEQLNAHGSDNDLMTKME